VSSPVNNGVSDDRRDAYLSQVAEYRQDLREYLRTLDCAQQWRSAASLTAEEGLAHDASVMARLHADGWNRFGWPEAAGGFGGNEVHRAVYFEELGHAMLPIPAQAWTLEVMGPAVLEFAPELAAEYLPGYLDGSEWWGQGFSEPESGERPTTARAASSSTDRRSGPARAVRPNESVCSCVPVPRRAATAV
jgi:acyl-CoA dehydrogenase